MNHRERVLTTLQHREPDKVPIDIGSSVNNLNDGVYKKVKQFLGIEREIEQFRGLMTSTYYDEKVLELLDVDTRHVWLNDPVEYRAVKDPHFNSTDYTDDWGARVKKVEGKGAFHVNPPLYPANIADLYSFEWPDPGDPVRVEGLKKRAERFHREGEYALVSNIVGHGGLIEHGCYLRGTDQFFMDVALDKKLVHALLARITDVFIGLYDVLLGEVGEYLDLVYWAEDFGTQTSLLLSPEMYREFFKHLHKKIFEFIKRKAPHVKLMFHSCGAVYPIVADLIETGIDILNPLQPLARGMDLDTLKQEYGNVISFCGAVDIQRALPGSLEDVEQEVKLRIRQLAPGGGYILAPANYIQNNTPPENVVHMCKTARSYGVYPIEEAP